MTQPREPILSSTVDGITTIDTVMAGERELNAVYLVHGSAPTLVEAAPGADGARVRAALEGLGVGPNDLAHVVVTHIHVDHAGGAAALLVDHPRATVWVHERGAAHLVDPARLLASTARTYGDERMRSLFGEMLPCPRERVRAISDGVTIPLGDRSLEVIHTPGHASHHVAYLDSATGAMFTGEALGSYLPWADAYRPALPPPEVDVEEALRTIQRIGERHPTQLLTSHFGPVANVDDALVRSAERVRAWSETVHDALEADPATEIDALTDMLREQAAGEFEADSGGPIDLQRYDALGSIRMNAAGLSRYWRKRWEREGQLVS